MSASKDYVVAIGGSVGGLSAIQALLTELPEQLDAPIVIAVHSNESSELASVLALRSALPIKQAEHNEMLKKGTIYVAPGATHVLFQDDKISLSEPVKNSGFRPSIDALFMTLAAQYKERAIAVVLSGTMQDGMRGAQIIHDMGGQTIVQDPKDAKEAGMPNSIIYNDHPEEILPASELGAWLTKLIGSVQG